MGRHPMNLQKKLCQGNGFYPRRVYRKGYGSRFQRFSGFFRCRQRFLVAEATQRTLTQIRERLERENGYTTMCVYQLAMISWLLLLLQRRLLQPTPRNKPKSRAVQHTCEGNNCQGHGNIISLSSKCMSLFWNKHQKNAGSLNSQLLRGIRQGRLFCCLRYNIITIHDST